MSASLATGTPIALPPLHTSETIAWNRIISSVDSIVDGYFNPSTAMPSVTAASTGAHSVPTNGTSVGPPAGGNGTTTSGFGTTMAPTAAPTQPAPSVSTTRSGAVRLSDGFGLMAALLLVGGIFCTL